MWLSHSGFLLLFNYHKQKENSESWHYTLTLLLSFLLLCVARYATASYSTIICFLSIFFSKISFSFFPRRHQWIRALAEHTFRHILVICCFYWIGYNAKLCDSGLLWLHGFRSERASEQANALQTRKKVLLHTERRKKTTTSASICVT